MTLDDLKAKGYVQDAKGTWYKPQKEWSATFREECIKKLMKPEYQHLLGIEKPTTRYKAGWRIVGNRKFYFRSRWEANYARYLEWLKARGELGEWEYEPKTFWFEGIKRGVVSYKPDFRLTGINGNVEYHEVKGYLNDKDKTKFQRMAKYYPDVKIKVIDQSWLQRNAKNLKNMVPNWETD